MTADIYMTPEGHQKAIEKLEYLKNVRRKELAKAVGIARSHGDLKENAEYHAAKEAQALNEERIAELEHKLSQAQILDEKSIPRDEVRIGATVTLKDLDTQEELKYTLVSELEANFDEGKISVTSPLARGLLGRKKDETAELNLPAGLIRYRILKIERETI